MATAFDWKAFLMPSWQKALLFLLCALILVPLIRFASDPMLGINTSAGPSQITSPWQQLLFGFFFWLIVAVVSITDIPAYIKIGRFDIIFLSLLGFLASYLLACALAHFLAPKQGKKR